MAAFAVWLMAAVKTNARYGPRFVTAASDDPEHDGKCFWPAKGFRPVYRLLRISGCCVCLSVGGAGLGTIGPPWRAIYYDADRQSDDMVELTWPQGLVDILDLSERFKRRRIDLAGEESFLGA